MKVYIASKACHRPHWRKLAKLFNITSRWIYLDDKHIGTTLGENDLDYTKLWVECIEDVCKSDCVIVYCEYNEVLKGALVEIGAALALGKRVYLVGDLVAYNANGTWQNHPLIQFRDGSVAKLLFDIGASKSVMKEVEPDHQSIFTNILNFKDVFTESSHGPLPDRLEKLEAHNQRMVEALKSCEAQFRDYADIHFVKGTHEGNQKMHANMDMAQLCFNAYKP